MSESSSKQEPAPSPAPEGKLIQIGGRQFRRNQARALKAQQDSYHAVALRAEPAMPMPAPEPAPLPVPTHEPSHFPEPQPAPSRRSSIRKRRRRLWPKIVSFILLAAIPALIGIAYYGHYATDQFVAQAQFAIRSQSSSSSEGSSGSSIFGGSLSNLGDTQIVAQYIHSDQLLKDVEDDVDIRALYSVEKADWWARLDPTVSREDLLGYWTWMSQVALDPATGIVTLSVRGFAPEDAKRISEAVLAESEKLVNHLSQRARDDAMKVADAEVAKAKAQVDQTFENLKTFQINKRQIDATKASEATSTRIEKLQGDLTSYETELASLRQVMSEDAPSIVYLRNRIEGVKKQLEQERARATTEENQTTVPQLAAEFEKLKLEQEFATKYYHSVLDSQKSALIEANRQVKYLEAFVRPRLPENSLYPNRPLMILMMVGGGIFIWLMALLITATIKEHL